MYGRNAFSDVTSLYREQCTLFNCRILQEREKSASKRLCFFETVLANKGLRIVNQKKPTIIEHLAFLSVKYSVQLSELFHALVTAREHGTATCENLTVEYRGNIRKEEIFLITVDGKVVVQFRIAKEHLLLKDLHIESWMNTDNWQNKTADPTFPRWSKT
jgi:hypothetical protein